MPTIRSISHRKILNSHVAFTTEFSIVLDDGSLGVGASSEGETISIYEDPRPPDSGTLTESLHAAGLIGRPLDQAELDGFLTDKIDEAGRNTCCALSSAFYDAVERSVGRPQGETPRDKLAAPRICCNILNGGWHAYTNPVLSDFHEYLLVARSDSIEEVIGHHNEIQLAVREALRDLPRALISGNPVCRFRTADNRECIEFLLGIRDRLGLSEEFDLMVDASGGDLWTGNGYRLKLTDDSEYSPEGFADYWLDICRTYPLRFLEDPFSETDTANWRRLAQAQETCRLVGDNFYSSDAERIAGGAADGCTHGVVLKPNQAGTITAVCRAFKAAKESGQFIVASHRSVSTESPLVATLACQLGAEYIKVGPLLTDYSSVIRVNEMIRLTT